MKKLLILAAAAALLLASCAKVETTTKNTMAENAPIVFSNYAPKSITKAAGANYAAGNVLIADADFDVYGWATANGTSFNGANGVKSNSHDFMEWYTVTYKADGNADGSKNAYPDGYRYWPSGDAPDYLSFYAYYPSNGAGITPPTGGLGAFSFTAQATAAAMVDFMVADVVKDQTYDTTNGNPGTNSGTDGTVNLTFKHMLTRVQFKFKTTQAVVDDTHTTIKVTDVKLYNALTTGTLTSAYNGTATTTTWSAQATPSASPYEVYVNGADINNFELTATAAPATNNAADIFLMVPQAMVTPAFTTTPNIPANLSNKPQYLVVEWDVITDGVTTHNSRALYFDTDLKTTDNITAAAAAMDLDWEKNASITYTLTIGPKPILFTAEVTSWADETNGFFNIQ
jgi:hypothetical protein